ncbi:hypothetical protein HYH03_002844 [Edaphochlamys debaryana]|uniref:Guanylate cyclase domain-containing protein n=1 Tax=Edaphochlamys debaryana TaxID=47281 RepID=A0A835YE79_9CHLO|nr:hypothetical protein HYH03_002844 [Edaphochlamys debaryana]|eukprot:KAG2499266.1 hypothetical protein HYH03_002844 [Edaphochlamys debaryana]
MHVTTRGGGGPEQRLEQVVTLQVVPCQYSGAPSSGALPAQTSHRRNKFFGGVGGLLGCLRRPRTVVSGNKDASAASHATATSTSVRVLGTLLVCLSFQPRDYSHQPLLPSSPGSARPGRGLSAGQQQSSSPLVAAPAAAVGSRAASGADGAWLTELAWQGLPACVTVFSADGAIVSQNVASKTYYGAVAAQGEEGAARCSARVDGVAGCAGAGDGGVLRRLFAHDGAKLEQLLQTTQLLGPVPECRAWEGIVRVPATLAANGPLWSEPVASHGDGPDLAQPGCNLGPTPRRTGSGEAASSCSGALRLSSKRGSGRELEDGTPAAVLQNAAGEEPSRRLNGQYSSCAGPSPARTIFDTATSLLLRLSDPLESCASGRLSTVRVAAQHQHHTACPSSTQQRRTSMDALAASTWALLMSGPHDESGGGTADGGAGCDRLLLASTEPHSPFWCDALTSPRTQAGSGGAAAPPAPPAPPSRSLSGLPCDASSGGAPATTLDANGIPAAAGTRTHNSEAGESCGDDDEEAMGEPTFRPIDKLGPLLSSLRCASPYLQGRPPPAAHQYFFPGGGRRTRSFSLAHARKSPPPPTSSSTAAAEDATDSSRRPPHRLAPKATRGPSSSNLGLGLGTAAGSSEVLRKQPSLWQTSQLLPVAARPLTFNQPTAQTTDVDVAWRKRAASSAALPAVEGAPPPRQGAPLPLRAPGAASLAFASRLLRFASSLSIAPAPAPNYSGSIASQSATRRSGSLAGGCHPSNTTAAPASAPGRGAGGCGGYGTLGHAGSGSSYMLGPSGPQQSAATLPLTPLSTKASELEHSGVIVGATTPLASPPQQQRLLSQLGGAPDDVTPSVSPPSERLQRLRQPFEPTGAAAAGAGPLAWHEVRAAALVDPGSGARFLVVMQKDVTAKVEAERHIAQVSETEHRLLEQVFPRHVLAYMTEQGFDQPQPLQPALSTAADGSAQLNPAWRPCVRDCTQLATWHPQVTVLFADIQGFTPMCKELPAAVVMKFLNDLFVRFDSLLDVYSVYKVETIGDCYVVAAGLIGQDADGMAAVQGGGEADPHQADRVFGFAQAMLRGAACVALPTTGEPVRIRVGIHSGAVVSGVVGTRMPRFCLFGDTINTASRMESTSRAGCIHVSNDTFSQLSTRRQFGWEATGAVEVKGKGLMKTFLWAEQAAAPLCSMRT